MINATIERGFSGLTMSITHNECCELKTLDDVLDEIQDFYRYVVHRDDTHIRFNVENIWIDFHVEEQSIFVFYNSRDIMFERICSKCEITIDDDSIHLYCHKGNKLVSHVKII